LDGTWPEGEIAFSQGFERAPRGAEDLRVLEVEHAEHRDRAVARPDRAVVRVGAPDRVVDQRTGRVAERRDVAAYGVDCLFVAGVQQGLLILGEQAELGAGEEHPELRLHALRRRGGVCDGGPLADDAVVPEAVHHAIGDDLARGVDRQMQRRFEQLGQRVFGNDAAHAGQHEHAGVVARVARHQHRGQVDTEALAQPAQRAALRCRARHDVQVAIAGVDDVHVEPGLRERVAYRVDLVGRGMQQIPARLEVREEFGRLLPHRLEAVEHPVDPPQIPALAQAPREILQLALAAEVVHLGADAGDHPIRNRQVRGVDDATDVVLQASGSVDQQRPRSARQPSTPP